MSATKLKWAEGDPMHLQLSTVGGNQTPQRLFCRVRAVGIKTPMTHQPQLLAHALKMPRKSNDNTVHPNDATGSSVGSEGKNDKESGERQVFICELALIYPSSAGTKAFASTYHRSLEHLGLGINLKQLYPPLRCGNILLGIIDQSTLN